VIYGIGDCCVFIEGGVNRVYTTGKFKWLNKETDRRRYMRFTSFFGMSSCMGSGKLGGGGTVISFGVGWISFSTITVEYVLGSD
jgi:hypothetical protein